MEMLLVEINIKCVLHLFVRLLGVELCFLFTIGRRHLPHVRLQLIILRFKSTFPSEYLKHLRISIKPCILNNASSTSQ